MKHRITLKEVLTVTLLALLALWSTTARSGGDYNAGARKSYFCAYCHGYDGNPLDAKIPRLAGQKAEYLIARVKALQASGAIHQSMQQAIITGDLGDKEIADLAAFYERQPVRK